MTFTDEMFAHQDQFSAAVLSLAASHNISCTSWGRSAKHNHAVGGVADSQHLNWLAVDIVLDDDVDREQLKKDIVGNGLQLIIETDHWHVQYTR